MVKLTRLLVAGAATAALVAGGALAAAPADAVSSFVHTKACPAGKSAQINWTSTGRVDLWRFPGNTSTSPVLVRTVTASGSYAWNSGQQTLTWGFGNSSGTLISYSETCVGFN